MADYAKNSLQTQPLASFPKSDHLILYVPPIHRPPPPKRASKCFVYSFAFFVLLCLLLLIFSLTVLRPKPLHLRLASHSLKSLSYDAQTPSFSAAFVASISVRNPNFTPIRLTSLSISFPDATGSGSRSARNKVIGCRSEEALKVSPTKAESKPAEDQEKSRLRDELNSGFLNLNGVVRAVGEVPLFQRVARKTYGVMECDIAIDLRSQQLLSFVCS